MAMAYKQKLFQDMKELLQKFHSLTPPDNMEDCRVLFSDFAGKQLPKEVLISLIGMGHEMGAVRQEDGHAVSFDQLGSMFCAGCQTSDTVEKLTPIVQKHIDRLEASSGDRAAGGAVGEDPAMQPDEESKTKEES
mmetsp:Transcript_26216/g.62082  ORF Transcript_26216/g.62082 Transcript_26216/m.62082 type:complete len:135 (-) Transcript_26216:52-456(-)